MKYIMLVDKAIEKIGTPDWPKGGQIVTGSFWERLPILFPDEITHSVLVEQLQKVYPGLVVLSAGFCSQSQDGWICDGFSTSLNVGAHPSDGSIMDRVIPFTNLDDSAFTED